MTSRLDRRQIDRNTKKNLHLYYVNMYTETSPGTFIIIGDSVGSKLGKRKPRYGNYSEGAKHLWWKGWTAPWRDVKEQWGIWGFLEMLQQKIPRWIYLAAALCSNMCNNIRCTELSKYHWSIDIRLQVSVLTTRLSWWQRGAGQITGWRSKTEWVRRSPTPRSPSPLRR